MDGNDNDDDDDDDDDEVDDDDDATTKTNTNTHTKNKHTHLHKCHNTIMSMIVMMMLTMMMAAWIDWQCAMRCSSSSVPSPEPVTQNMFNWISSKLLTVFLTT